MDTNHRIGHLGVLVWPGRAGLNWELHGGGGHRHGHGASAAGTVGSSTRVKSARGTHSTGDSPSAAQLSTAEQLQLSCSVFAQLVMESQLYLSICISQLSSTLQLLLSCSVWAWSGIFSPCLDNLVQNFVILRRIGHSPG